MSLQQALERLRAPHPAVQAAAVAAVFELAARAQSAAQRDAALSECLSHSSQAVVEAAVQALLALPTQPAAAHASSQQDLLLTALSVAGPATAATLAGGILQLYERQLSSQPPAVAAPLLPAAAWRAHPLSRALLSNSAAAQPLVLGSARLLARAAESSGSLGELTAALSALRPFLSFLLLDPQLAAAQPLPPLPGQPGSPLGPQASVVMEDVENDVEFQSMFESKYETGAAAPGAPAARRSPSLTNGSSLPSIGGGAPGASLMAADAGNVAPAVAAAVPSITPALPVKNGSLGGSGSPAGGSIGGGGVAHSPNTLLPTHISVFGDGLSGDGLSGLDLRHAAAAAAAASAAARHPVQLPSHISEFGGEEDACAGEDAVQCADRDANTMSVMKAALPDDDDLLAGALT
jgi:hypothetical protein